MTTQGISEVRFTTFWRDIILLKGWKYDIMKPMIFLFYFGVIMGIISLIFLIFLINQLIKLIL